MAKHLTMKDVENILDNKSVYVVVEVNTMPVVTLVTTDYNQAKGCYLLEENSIMLSISPETIARIKSGELLELKV